MDGSQEPPFSVSLEVTHEGLRITSEPISGITFGAETIAAALYKQKNLLEKAPAALSLDDALHDLKRRATQTAILEDNPLAKVLRRILFLEADPRSMRQYSEIQETGLKPDGSGLSSVLYRLTEEGHKKGILEIIRSLPEQDISEITYLKGPLGEIMVQLHETFGGKPVPREAALLSDGTLRVLATAAALFSVEEGSVVVIEEIDNGVHPSRAGHLLSQIQKVARERHLRVLLTTHNPALLDALPLDAIPDTVACYRDPERGDSRLIRLEDLEGYPELVSQGPIGHLLTRGILDRYLKSPDLRDRARKVARDRAWVEELRRQA